MMQLVMVVRRLGGFSPSSSVPSSSDLSRTVSPSCSTSFVGSSRPFTRSVGAPVSHLELFNAETMFDNVRAMPETMQGSFCRAPKRDMISVSLCLQGRQDCFVGQRPCLGCRRHF
ncbi:hypothetical protein FALCPG4_013453 [Fusarium falciforme]